MNGHQRRRAATREKVLAAARELLAEEGRDGLTVVAVARRAGVSEGSVYKIFSSRAGLEAAAMPGLWEQVVSAVAATPATRHPLRRLLLALEREMGGASDEEMLLTRLVSDVVDDEVDALRYRVEEILTRSAAAGLTQSRRSRLSEEEALLWSSVFLAAMRTANLSRPSTQRDFVDALTRYVDVLVPDAR
jgi:AcrR family transcriptional regulator